MKYDISQECANIIRTTSTNVLLICELTPKAHLRSGGQTIAIWLQKLTLIQTQGGRFLSGMIPLDKPDVILLGDIEMQASISLLMATCKSKASGNLIQMY